MKYIIRKPFLLFAEDGLEILSDEVNNFSTQQIERIIEDIENVFNGKYEASSFGYEVALVHFDATVAKVEYYDDHVTNLSTKEIYDALKDWLAAIKRFELEAS